MDIYRLRLRPLGPWLTPWQADTLMGLLAAVCARTQGPAVMRQELLEPSAHGTPPFVLSDAFPGELFPLPASLRAAVWPVEARKSIKRARWITSDAFRRYQQGERLTENDLIRQDPLSRRAQLRNAIGRESNSTDAKRGGALFPTEETYLQDTSYLSVYARIAPGKEKLLTDLFEELALTGYGKDASVGKGEFVLDGTLESADWLTQGSGNADSVITLSTFQPGPTDPTEGVWESFVKYGKLGPDFGLDNVFKRPLLLFRPGATFGLSTQISFLGRMVPMDEILSSQTCAVLRAQGAEIGHFAWGLTVPSQSGVNTAVV